MKVINKFLLILCLLSSSQTYPGFFAGTLVKTPLGRLPIEQLEVGSSIICYDFKGNCVERPITHLIKKHTQACIQISLPDEKLYVEPDHTFYLPQTQEWIKAKDLTSQHILLGNCTHFIKVEAVQLLLIEGEVYDITVADYHNFCVSEQDIHAHNILPFVAIGVGIAFGGGGGGVTFFVTGTIGLGALAIGGILYESSQYNRRIEKRTQTYGNG
jgi:hypothetical protein